MSDARERSLARDQADVDARAQVLRARLRQGELSAARLEVLAHCGDAAAAQVTERPVGADPLEASEAFFLELVRLDPDAACRLGLECAGPLLEALANQAPFEDRPREAVTSAWAWLETEDLAAREAARVAAALAHEDADQGAEALMDLELEGVELDLALVAWGAIAPIRLAIELREEILEPLAKEVLSELQAGFAELGQDEGFLLGPLELLKSWCLLDMTR